MTFNDDDLKRLKDEIGRYVGEVGFKHAKEIKALIARLEAAEAFMSRVELIQETPEYIAVWCTSQNHIGRYQGPRWDSELEIWRRASGKS